MFHIWVCKVCVADFGEILIQMVFYIHKIYGKQREHTHLKIQSGNKFNSLPSRIYHTTTETKSRLKGRSCDILAIYRAMSCRSVQRAYTKHFSTIPYQTAYSLLHDYYYLLWLTKYSNNPSWSEVFFTNEIHGAVTDIIYVKW